MPPSMSSCSLSSSPFSFRKKAKPSRLSAVSARASGAAPSSSESCPPFNSMMSITRLTSCSALSDAGLRTGMSMVEVMKLRMKSSTVSIILALLRLISARLGGSAMSTACLRNLVSSAGLIAYSSSFDTIEGSTAGRNGAGGAGMGTSRFPDVGFGVTAAGGAVGRGTLAKAGGVAAVRSSRAASCARVRRGRMPESALYRPHMVSTMGMSIFLSISMLMTPARLSCSKIDSSSRSSSCLRKVSDRAVAARDGGLCARARRATPNTRWIFTAACVLVAAVSSSSFFFSCKAAVSDCSRAAWTRASLRCAVLDSEKSASSVLGEAVSAAGVGSSSASAEIAGLSTASVCRGRAFA